MNGEIFRTVICAFLFVAFIVVAIDVLVADLD